MKKNIIVYTVSIILAFVLGSLFAIGFGGRWNRVDFERGRGFRNDSGPGYQRGYMHTDVMKSRLGLSDQQVKQMFDLGTEYRAKYFENRNNADKLTELRAAHQKAIENILTKDQLEKFNSLKGGDGRFGCFSGHMFRGF